MDASFTERRDQHAEVYVQIFKRRRKHAHRRTNVYRHRRRLLAIWRDINRQIELLLQKQDAHNMRSKNK